MRRASLATSGLSVANDTMTAGWLHAGVGYGEQSEAHQLW